MTSEETKRTIYIHNLNEKIKIVDMKAALMGMFSQFGQVLDIHVRRTIKTKGQAWVSFGSVESAIAAVTSMNGFDFYEKPMRVSYANKDSDAVLKIDQGDSYIPRERKPKGERDRLQFERDNPQLVEQKRQEELLKQQQQQQQEYEKQQQQLYEQHQQQMYKQQQEQAQNAQNAGFQPPTFQPQQPYNPYAQPYGQPQAQPEPEKPKPKPATENPPNKILLLVSLPDDTTESKLLALFGNQPGLVEIRLIPGRTDVAFIEYENVHFATQAKDYLNDYPFGDEKVPLTIMFAKAS